MTYDLDTAVDVAESGIVATCHRCRHDLTAVELILSQCANCFYHWQQSNQCIVSVKGGGQCQNNRPADTDFIICTFHFGRIMAGDDIQTIYGDALTPVSELGAP